MSCSSEVIAERRGEFGVRTAQNESEQKQKDSVTSKDVGRSGGPYLLTLLWLWLVDCSSQAKLESRYLIGRLLCPRDSVDAAVFVC